MANSATARARADPQERDGQQALGRDVEQVELTVEQRRSVAPLRARIERGVEERRAHAELAQRVDLVLHQRDQRRDDDAGALALRSSAGTW
jgi:hypothetical protein